MLFSTFQKIQKYQIVLKMCLCCPFSKGCEGDSKCIFNNNISEINQNVEQIRTPGVDIHYWAFEMG